MDWTAINARMEAMARERKEQLVADRKAILVILRQAGIARVDARYDGYGDSGNIEDVTFEPDGVQLAAGKLEELKDFLWAVPYDLHPGFEINEGGCGEVTWDIAGDRIDVDHPERFVETNHYAHEDV